MGLLFILFVNDVPDNIDLKVLTLATIFEGQPDINSLSFWAGSNDHSTDSLFKYDEQSSLNLYKIEPSASKGMKELECFLNIKWLLGSPYQFPWKKDQMEDSVSWISRFECIWLLASSQMHSNLDINETESSIWSFFARKVQIYNCSVLFILLHGFCAWCANIRNLERSENINVSVFLGSSVPISTLKFLLKIASNTL